MSVIAESSMRARNTNRRIPVIDSLISSSMLSNGTKEPIFQPSSGEVVYIRYDPSRTRTPIR